MPETAMFREKYVTMFPNFNFNRYDFFFFFKFDNSGHLIFVKY